LRAEANVPLSETGHYGRLLPYCMMRRWRQVTAPDAAA